MLNDSNEMVLQSLQDAMRYAAQQLSKEIVRESLSSPIQLEQLVSVASNPLQPLSAIQRAGSQDSGSATKPQLSNDKGLGAQLEKASIFDGFLFSPIIRGLIGLIRGTPDVPPSSPEKYVYPLGSVSTVGAEVQGDGAAIFNGYDGQGVSRRVSPINPTININVDALDARSIMDRSDDIAAAIRQAVLSNSSLNDSLGEI